MGVPALFRWLSKKYPKIVSPVIESARKDVNGEDIEVDISTPNPNGEEFDNLYLDMNGIVHPCSHPEDRPPPQNEDEIMMEIFRYTDRIMAMVRPRKLLMIAVDGVAPRAKMNQQRSRRFRSAQEAEESAKKKQEAIDEIIAAGGEAPEEVKAWDSNVITPGTPFMDILAASLRYWVTYKLNNDPGWKNIKVIISDASVPGEGEHKIMEFVRSQRSDPAYDPNTRHVIYGLDADLIMLGLATHEPYFRVLREDVFFQPMGNGCRICGEKGHMAAECTAKVEPNPNAPPKPFIWLNVATLREYLEVELHVPGQRLKFDLERAIDDWVFIIFFVGNDFLPHLPSLNIHEGAIDSLVALWKKNLDIQGGYITCDGTMDLKSAQLLLDGLAESEEEIFKRRKQNDDRQAQREKQRAKAKQDRNGSAKKVKREDDLDGSEQLEAAVESATIVRTPVAKNKGKNTIPDFDEITQSANGGTLSSKDILEQRRLARGGDAKQANTDAAAKLKASMLAGKTDPETPGNKTPVPESDSTTKKRAFGEFAGDEVATLAEEPEANPDTVRLWEPGFRERYYEQKFKCEPYDVDFRRSIARDYVEGLAWVLLYYYQGCHSWTWFYPHHYAPFAADFDQIANAEIKFEKGHPAKPYEQLLGVMPIASNHVLPGPLQKLMTDEEYGIQDFYPLDFPVDLNGKKFAWQGVVLLPFIDQERLLEACAKGYKLLTAEESRRNAKGHDQLIFSETNQSLYNFVITSLYSKKAKDKSRLDMQASGGLGGTIEKDPAYTPNGSIPFPLQSRDTFPDIETDTTVAVKYRLSKKKHIHKSMLLKGHIPPRRILDRRDLDNVRYDSSRNDRFGNNNRARDVHDPAQHRTAPRPPWQQTPPQVNGVPIPLPGQFGAPPIPIPVPGQRTGVPIPIPVPGQRTGAPIPIPVPGQRTGAPVPIALPTLQDPYSKYQGSSGQQWQGYHTRY